MTEFHPCGGCVRPEQFEVVAESCQDIESTLGQHFASMQSASDRFRVRVDYTDTMIGSGFLEPSPEQRTKLALARDVVQKVADATQSSAVTFFGLREGIRNTLVQQKADGCDSSGHCMGATALYEYRAALRKIESSYNEETRSHFSRFNAVQ